MDGTMGARAGGGGGGGGRGGGALHFAQAAPGGAHHFPGTLLERAQGRLVFRIGIAEVHVQAVQKVHRAGQERVILFLASD